MSIAIGIIGAGVMGKGIAKSFSKIENANILIYDKFVINNNDISVDNIKCTNRFLDLANADIIIEAIFENLQEKLDLYKKLEDIVSDKTLICSNTSSLSISKLSSILINKKRFLGVHFMNPADKNDLVEIIPSIHTERENIDYILKLLKDIGKIAVIANDSPGFIVNRILIPMINDAVNILDDGIASKEDIDNSMKIAAKHPIGPLALADLIGLDVILNIMENLHNNLNNAKYTPSPLLYKMVKENKIGKKVKVGFYKYE